MSRIETVKDQIQQIAKRYTENKGQTKPELTVKDFLAEAALSRMMQPCNTARDFTGMARCAEDTKAIFYSDPDRYIDRYLTIDTKENKFNQYMRIAKLRKVEDQTRVALAHQKSTEPCNSESEYAQKMDAIDRHYDQCFNTILRGYYNDTPQFITDTLLTVYGCME